MRPSVADLMRALDDLAEVRETIERLEAPTPELMEAERLLLRSLAILHAHMRFLVAVDVA
jgi:hypothetical protein